MPVIRAVIRATDAHLALIKQFVHEAAHRQINLGDEDLAALVPGGHLLLAVDQEPESALSRLRLDRVQALAAFYPEPRPPSLPPAAPDRVYLRAAAFRNGASPSTGLQELVTAWSAAPVPAPVPAGRLLIAYGGEPWYNRSLLAAGCTLAEEVIFFELPNLQRAVGSLSPASSAHSVRPASPAELNELAALDAACFDVLWHMGVADLRSLSILGTVTVEERDGALAGYLALTIQGDAAQVARLAVHPAWSGHGIGRHLLADGLRAAAQLGCTRAILNTQANNSRSQALYHSLGFRPTGERFEVYTRPAPA